MRKEFREIEKKLYNDYIIKFPLEQVKENPKLEEIKISTNMDNKGRGNIYKVDSSKEMREELKKLIVYYMKIFGQTPKIIKVKKSVASWNIRKGMENGVLITLKNSGRLEEWW